MIINGHKHFGELAKFAKSINSQLGEDGILEEIFNRLGQQFSSRSLFFVDFGAGNGIHISNTKYLADVFVTSGLYIEGCLRDYQDLVSNKLPGLCLHKYISLEGENNLNKTLEDIYSQSHLANIDLLSMDVDGNEYWIWQDFKYNPKVVCIEYNPDFEPSECKTIKYDPNHRWDHSKYFGASAGALNKLAESKGYTLVACSHGLNLFFIRNDLMDKFKKLDINVITKRSTSFEGRLEEMIDV